MKLSLLFILLIQGSCSSVEFYNSHGPQNVLVRFNSSHKVFRSRYLFISIYDVDKKKCPNNFLGVVRIKNEGTQLVHFPEKKDVAFSTSINVNHFFGGFGTHQQGYFRVKARPGQTYEIKVEESEGAVTREVLVHNKGKVKEIESLKLDHC